jgi:uncharacterized protein YjiS (DUF1127 family)
LHIRAAIIALHKWAAIAYMTGIRLLTSSSSPGPGAPQETAMKILSRARNWMKSRQTAQELANLSNETLADIGLTRFDIDNVARGLRTR